MGRCSCQSACFSSSPSLRPLILPSHFVVKIGIPCPCQRIRFPQHKHHICNQRQLSQSVRGFFTCCRERRRHRSRRRRTCDNASYKQATRARYQCLSDGDWHWRWTVPIRMFFHTIGICLVGVAHGFTTGSQKPQHIRRLDFQHYPPSSSEPHVPSQYSFPYMPPSTFPTHISAT